MESDIPERILEYLKALPSFRLEELQWEVVIEGRRLDGLLTLASPIGTVEYALEYKKRILSSSVGAIVNQLRTLVAGLKVKPLLLAERISEPVAQMLRQEGIEYLDAGGNMYLNSPAAYILISGRQPSQAATSNQSTSLTATDLKLVYVLLHEPEALEIGHRELSQKAGISLGAVSNAIKTLQATGYLVRLKNKKNRIDNYRKLLARWEVGYAEALRPKLLIGTYAFARSHSQQEQIAAINQQAESGNCLIGGEAGAAKITNYLRPKQFTLHVGEKYRSLLTQLLLKPAANGEVTLLKQFGVSNPWLEKPFIADPLLVRVELLTQNDSRLQETADLLLDQYIRQEKIHAH